MPAVLTLMGGRLFAWSFGAPRLLSAPWSRLVGAERAGPAPRRHLRRSGHAGARGAGDPGAQHQDRPARSRSSCPPTTRRARTSRRSRRRWGPGFPYAFNIVVASDSGPITERKTLRALEQFQVQLAKDARVESVAGPGEFRAETADLGTLKTQLNDSKKLLKGAAQGSGQARGRPRPGRRRGGAAPGRPA